MAEWREPAVGDHDRLPWLETVDGEPADGPSAVRVVLLVLVGLALIAVIIFGFYRYQQAHAPGGNGDLIVAQDGDYKVKPDQPGGMKVGGEGDAAIATSDGSGSGNASIDLKAVPEAPIAGQRATPGTAAAATGASKAVTVIPASGGQLKAAPAAQGARSAGGNASGGSLVQLGSFPAEDVANASWARASKRFSYLAPLGKSVVKADVNGRTVYRLRVNAGSAGAASELCGKLKVAGEACFVAND